MTEGQYLQYKMPGKRQVLCFNSTHSHFDFDLALETTITRRRILPDIITISVSSLVTKL